MSSGTGDPIELLLVEDNPGDVRLVVESLRGLSVKLHSVERLSAAIGHLQRAPVDVVLLDLGLPDSQGLETLRALVASAPEVPVVVLTGHHDETAGRAALREGAQDYLVKGDIVAGSLGRTIEYALEREQTRRRLRHSNQILTAIRNINHLIVHARNAQDLIARACVELTDTRGFAEAVICLADAGGKVTAVAGSRVDRSKPNPADQISPGATHTCLSVLSHEGLLVGEALRRTCAAWPFIGASDATQMVTRLESQGRVVGILAVTCSSHASATPEEQVLLRELATDLAHALNGLEQEERRRAAEELMRVHVRLLEHSAGHSLKDLLQKTLDEVEVLTGSVVGFYHFVEADQQTLSLQAWSTRTVTQFCEAKGEGLHYDLAQAGVWADCVRLRSPVIHNDYASLVDKKGLPQGHAHLVRELVVPIFRQGKVVAILGVGNKPTDYVQADVGTVAYLADVAWEIVRRKQAEEALSLSNHQLRTLNAVAARLAAAGSSTTLFDFIARTVKELSGGAASTFAGYHPDEKCIRVEYLDVDGRPDAELKALRAQLAEASLPIDEAVRLTLVKSPLSVQRSLAEAGRGAVPRLAATVMAELRGVDRFVSISYVLGEELFGTSLVALSADAPDPPLELLTSFSEMVSLCLRRVGADAQRERLATAIEQAAEMVIITDGRANIVYVNPAFEAATGYSRAEVLGRNPRLLQSGVHDEVFYRSLWATLSGGGTWHGRMVNKKKDGTLYTEESTISPIRDPRGVTTSYVAVKRDMTQALAAQAEFLQAQKMEGIGRLAGGVAHDFNNLLTVILSHAAYAIESLADGAPLREELIEVQAAGRRAAALTRQLLAFSRKQILQPVSLDLNETVGSMEKMLRRILGEDVELVQVLEPELSMTMADPGQMEQVLMNLVVNARDAMPRGGTLTIATKKVELTAELAGQVALKPGPYVQLTITDTGAGMDELTRTKIFEPFFTTKERGKGTGLGLSTVDGIVRQSGGGIGVHTEVGRGTTFKVYFPCSGPNDRAALLRNTPLPRRAPTGTGTVLVVDDDEALRNIVRRTLTAAGYAVLIAADGQEALALCAQRREAIDLLIADVVMPRMGGRVLAEELVKVRPGIKVLYMSGYTDDAIVQHGVFDGATQFLPKPFTPADVTRKVREVMDRVG